MTLTDRERKALDLIARAMATPGELVPHPEEGISYRVRKTDRGFFMLEHVHDGQERGVGFNFLRTDE